MNELPFHEYFTDIVDARRRPVEWIVRDLIPTGLTLVSGPPKISRKTTALLAIAEMVSGVSEPANSYFPSALCHVDTPGPVLFFPAEDDAGELREKLEVAFQVRPTLRKRLFIADDPALWQLDDEHGMTSLMGWLAEANPVLVCMDPFREFHRQDENDSTEMITLLRPIQTWAKKHKRAFILSHHVTKPSPQHEGQASLFTVRGSGAIVGKVDSNHIIRPEKDGTLRWQAIFKRAREWDRTLRMGAWGPKAEFVLTDWEQGVKGLWERGLRSPADIAAQLKGGPEAVKGAIEELKRWEVIR
jgi:hypothetical protein